MRFPNVKKLVFAPSPIASTMKLHGSWTGVQSKRRKTLAIRRPNGVIRAGRSSTKGSYTFEGREAQLWIWVAAGTRLIGDGTW